MTLNIVADANMPLVEELFSSLGAIKRVEGRSLENKDLVDADILLVRSVTQVDRGLLANTPIKFVGTATIGTDHIDQDYLALNKIGFASAQGCNANSVAEYILSVLVCSGVLQDLLGRKLRLAIVGAGNVGSRLAYFAKALGLDFGCYDPPLRNKQNINTHNCWEWIDWQQVISADVISLHVPITDSGEYPTKHMFNRQNLPLLKDGCLLINSARGGVVDNEALLNLFNESGQSQLKSVLDVWENEPNINLQLRNHCILGSPHIAGYSKDGKEKGSQMLHHALLKFLNKPMPVDAETAPIQASIEWSQESSFDYNLQLCILAAYDIRVDSYKLDLLDQATINRQFDLLRKNYPDRLEFKHYEIVNVPHQYAERMQQLGFRTTKLGTN